MYKLFEGPAYLIGVKNDVRNCKGFIGEHASLDRGNPGFIPNKKESLQSGKISNDDHWQCFYVYKSSFVRSRFVLRIYF